MVFNSSKTLYMLYFILIAMSMCIDAVKSNLEGKGKGYFKVQ